MLLTTLASICRVILAWQFCLGLVAFAVLYKFVLSNGGKMVSAERLACNSTQYAGFLTWALRHPGKLLTGMTILLFASWDYMTRQSNIVLFPEADPNFIMSI